MTAIRRKDQDVFGLSLNGNGLFLRNVGPIAIGTGLVALDIVVTDREKVRPRLWAGGTCGNVLSILAYLGWRTYPVATLGNDLAAQLVSEDMKRFRVNTRYLRRSDARHTPIVVEKIRTIGPGEPRHRFVWTCPNCGAWFPGYQAILAKDAREIVPRMPAPSVFFFDRVSRGALELARASAEHGAVVVFEPSGIRDERLFLEAVELSHIVKYSHERLGHLQNSTRYKPPILEIETLGRGGLRYRCRPRPRAVEPWSQMDAFPIRELRDSAGAGDWCTAGIIHALAAGGGKQLREISRERVEDALRLGQALSAVKCRYEGARGPMYALSKKQMEVSVKEVLIGGAPARVEDDREDSGLGDLIRAICPSCDSRKEELSGTPKHRS